MSLMLKLKCYCLQRKETPAHRHSAKSGEKVGESHELKKETSNNEKSIYYPRVDAIVHTT